MTQNPQPRSHNNEHLSIVYDAKIWIGNWGYDSTIANLGHMEKAVLIFL